MFVSGGTARFDAITSISALGEVSKILHVHVGSFEFRCYTYAREEPKIYYRCFGDPHKRPPLRFGCRGGGGA